MKNRLSSCAAAADILNGRTNSVARRRHQRQRRWCWDDSMTKRKRKSCVNVWYAITSWCNGVARKEVKKPSVSSGSFAHFSSRGVKKTCRWHVFSLRSRRLCRRSIYLVLHRTAKVGRRRPSSSPRGRNTPYAYIGSTYRQAAKPATAPSPTAVVSWRTDFTRPSPAANTPSQPVWVSSPAA